MRLPSGQVAAGARWIKPIVLEERLPAPARVDWENLKSRNRIVLPPKENHGRVSQRFSHV